MRRAKHARFARSGSNETPTSPRADHGRTLRDMGFSKDIGIIDLGIGFPFQSIEEKKATYDFFRPLLKDQQSKEEFEFPAQYMFKDVPDIVPADVDPVRWTVEKMDAFGIEQ